MPPTVAALGVSMFLLQAAIGAGNDLADVERDRNRRDKPLAAGDLPVAAGRALGITAAMLGLVLAAIVGPPALLVALVGLGVGLAYDFRLRGTPWSWLPFAVGVPLLPVYAWAGGSGCLPAASLLLVPLAGLAGAQLALANALADLEADRAAGVRSVATAMGRGRTWRTAAVLSAAVVIAAVASLAPFGGRGPALAVVGVAVAVVAASVALSAGATPKERQLGWALDCLGLALLAAGWIGAVAGSGSLPVPPC